MATFHRRAEWEQYTTQNVTGPAQDKTPVVYLTIHYNGTTEDLDGPNNVLEDEDYARFLARTNNAYWSSRGYALGYNWGLAPDGDLWEIRGTDIRCAANGCQAVNVPAVAVQVTVANPAARPTDAQLEALRDQWVPWIRTQYPQPLDIVGHRDLNPRCSNPTGTICPGPVLYPLVQAGFFDTPQEDDVTDADIAKIAAAVVKLCGPQEVWNFLTKSVPGGPPLGTKTEDMLRSIAFEVQGLKSELAAIRAGTAATVPAVNGHTTKEADRIIATGQEVTVPPLTVRLDGTVEVS